MIQTKQQLREYLKADRAVDLRGGLLRTLFSDHIRRLKTLLRLSEYHYNNRHRSVWHMVLYGWTYARYLYALRRVGSEIPLNVFGKGLTIWHAQGIIVNKDAQVGDYCSLSARCVIAHAHNENPILGDHVGLGINATILGGISIADHVRIGANALVLKTISEAGTTWAGQPARKISDNSNPDRPEVQLN